MDTKMIDKVRKEELLAEYWRQFHAKHRTVEKIELLNKLWGIWVNLYRYKLSSDELFELKQELEIWGQKKDIRYYGEYSAMYVDSKDATYLHDLYNRLESKKSK